MSRADNKEKYKEYDHQYYIKHKRPKSKIGQAEQQIADLEAKLAESESKRKSLEEKVKFLTEETEENFVDGQKYNELKQQLDEKEKEIEQLKKFDDLNRNFFALFRTAFKEPNKVDDLFNTLKTIQEKQDQDKISFAVEQLELAKEKIIKVPMTDYDLSRNFEKMYKQDAIRQIDNQIKQLKEGIKNE